MPELPEIEALADHLRRHAVGLTVGQTMLTARHNRATDWQAFAPEAGRIPGSLFALDAPELVFQFYLRRPVLVTPDYQTFAQTTEARYLLAPIGARRAYRRRTACEPLPPG